MTKPDEPTTLVTETPLPKHHEHLSPDVEAQLKNIAWAKDRPLIVSDGDEVIFAFMHALEAYLNAQDLFIRLDSFALTGNIRRQEDGVVLDGPEVRDLIGNFFADCTEDIPLIPGAKDALDELAQCCEIVMLTNIPIAQREERVTALQKGGLDFPVIANTGRKGPALAWIAEQVSAPIFFLDDIPHNIESAAALAPTVRSIHFVGDMRLAKLIDKSEHAEARIDSWELLLPYLKEQLNNYI